MAVVLVSISMHNPMFGKHKKNSLVLGAVIVGLLATLAPLSAAVKDSDADGVTDQAEREIYLTNPLNPDTDNDSFSDGEELVNGTDPLNKMQNPLREAEKQFPPKRFFSNSLEIETPWLYGIALIITTSLLGLGGYFIARKKRSQAPPETSLPDTD